MKVLVSDNLADAGIQMFRDEVGIEVDVKTSLAPEEIKAIIGSYDALVIRSATKVTEDLLQAAKNLKVVGRAGIGLDNVDIPAATKRGIAVMNTPGGNVVTTAEHAISMMLALSRNIPQGTSSLKEGRWDKKKLQGQEIFNKVLGIIGFGKIGSIVADRARGLKMRVIVHDPFVTPEMIEKAGYESVSKEALYQRADYISVHVPKLKDTLGMLNREAFAQMKDGVRIINCARGGIIHEGDLQEAIESGKISGAALDVFEQEPPGAHPLLSLERVICTPHLGASTREAQTNVATAVAEQIIDFLKNGTIINAVNVPSVTGELLKQLHPLLTLGDRMGCLLAQLVKDPIEAVDIEYIGDFRNLDLTPVTLSVLKGMLDIAVKDDVNFINARMIAKERGINVTEMTRSESEDFTQLMTIRAKTKAKDTTICGTIYGKDDFRVVKINDFRLELVPKGHIALITNDDKPGAIGSIGTALGNNQININRMQVGQDAKGENNIIFLATDTPIPDEVVKQLLDLPMVSTVMPLEL